MTLNLSLHEHSRDPQPPPTVQDVQKCLNCKGNRLAVDGIFGPRTDAAVKAFQKRAGLDVDGIVGPHTWSALSELMPPAPVNRSAKALAALAYKIVTGGYQGGRHPAYVFGAENDPFHPELVTQTDCSELVQVCVSYLIRHLWIDGSRWQYAVTQPISVAQASQTPGALLFHSENGLASGIHHVAVSLGDGRTAEARTRRAGTGIWRVAGRFNLAGLVPGLNYSKAAVSSLASISLVDLFDMEIDPTLPTEIDSIPFDHVGEFDELEDRPDEPPFDIEAELADISEE